MTSRCGYCAGLHSEEACRELQKWREATQCSPRRIVIGQLLFALAAWLFVLLLVLSTVSVWR